MPGLLKGAHQGKGLGIQFLRHIERTRVLVFLIESTSKHPKDQFEVLLEELRSFRPELAKKPQIVAITKMDLADDELRRQLKKVSFKRGVPVIPISGTKSLQLTSLLVTTLIPCAGSMKLTFQSGAAFAPVLLSASKA